MVNPIDALVELLSDVPRTAARYNGSQSSREEAPSGARERVTFCSGMWFNLGKGGDPIHAGGHDRPAACWRKQVVWRT